MTDIPTAIARQADNRALEIFENAALFGKTFKECLGEIYMIGIQAGAQHQGDGG